MAPHLISSKILDHHPLNLSDHLPISISLKIPNMGSRQCHPSSKSINWSKAISSGSIKVYEEKVKLHIAPLLQTPLLSVDDIDCEIRSVATFLIAAAEENLPLFNSSNRRFILDHKLSALCKLSKIIWRRWSNSGRPNNGPLYREMKESRRAVKKHIVSCRARKERSDIQKHDNHFKNRDNRRYRVFRPTAVCSKLINDDNKSVTEPIEIAELFRDFFSNLAASHVQENIQIANETINITSLEGNSFLQNDQILDMEFSIEEIELSLRTSKLGNQKELMVLCWSTFYMEVDLYVSG